LAVLASRLFSIVPHAAEEERIFSCLSLNNTKTRNCLAVATMEKIYQVKNYLFRKQTGNVPRELLYDEEVISLLEEDMNEDMDETYINGIDTAIEEILHHEWNTSEIDVESWERYFEESSNDFTSESSNFDALRSMYNFDHPIFDNGSSLIDMPGSAHKLPTLQDFQLGED
jgi:hypothetical protein